MNPLLTSDNVLIGIMSAGCALAVTILCHIHSMAVTLAAIDASLQALKSHEDQCDQERHEMRDSIADIRVKMASITH